jgi:hypothetical protein
MKRGSTLLLKGVIALMGLAVLGICIFAIPRVVGSFDMRGYDPILIGMYIPAVPFLFALYQAWKLLSYIDNNNAFSQSSVKALKNIKYCAIVISGIYAAGMPFIFRVADLDDAPGVVALGVIIIAASVVIATFAALLQKLLQNGMDIKSENELTV